MNNNSDIKNDSPAKALDFGRATQNLVIPIPEIIGLCVESKAVLMDLLDLTDDSEEIEAIKFVNLTLSICADFFGDALDEEAAKKTAWKRSQELMKFREYLKEIINNKK